MTSVLTTFIRIPLTDARFLSAHLWRPADSRPIPAILEFRPYRGYDLFRPLEERYLAAWADYGYAVLAIDIAGSGQSSGLLHDEYLPREIDDAIAAIAWCADQAWCDGQVGLSGMSWAAFTALRVSARRPPALKAMVLGGVSEDGWRTDIHNLGGVPYVAEVDWAGVMLLLNALPPDPQEFGDGWKTAWLERLAANRPWVQPWLAHRARDAYWSDKAFDPVTNAPDLPLLLYAGWADKYATSVLRIAEAWPGPVRTLIGPWEHAVPDVARRRPRIDFLGEALRWWNHWLKGEDTGVPDDAPLRAWIAEPDRQGGGSAGRWVAASWPAPESRTMTLALTDPGQLGAPGEGRAAGLTTRLVPAPRTPETLHVDRYEDEPGPFDPTWIDGGLCAVTAPMDADIDLCGAPVLRCRAWTDQPGGQVVARLLDIDPDGAAVRMTTGALNLAFRDRFDRPSPPAPGEPMDLAIPLQATAWRLKRGHRLALVLSAEGWPTLWPDRGGAEIAIAADSLALRLPLLDETGPEPVFAEPSRLAATEVGPLKWIDSEAEPLPSAGLANAAAYASRGAAHHLPATGTDYFSAARFEVALREDGREAVAVRVGRAAFQRPGWSVRVETRLEVTSKPGVFEVSWSIRAEHNGAVVHDHSEMIEVPRGG
jgi:hypothetical protein